VRAKALTAYRRHRFVDEAMGEEAVARTLKSGEAVLDMLFRELTKAAAASSARAPNLSQHGMR
jgi:hypothetical protein